MCKKSLLLLLSSAALLFSCGGGNPSASSTLESEPSIVSSLSQEDNDEFHKIYDRCVAAARAKDQTPLSYEKWLASIRGDKSEPGRDVSAYYDNGSCTNCFRHVSVGFASGISVNAKGQAITFIAINKPELYTETLQFDEGIWNTLGLDYDNGVCVSLK